MRSGISAFARRVGNCWILQTVPSCIGLSGKEKENNHASWPLHRVNLKKVNSAKASRPSILNIFNAYSAFILFSCQHDVIGWDRDHGRLLSLCVAACKNCQTPAMGPVFKIQQFCSWRWMSRNQQFTQICLTSISETCKGALRNKFTKFISSKYTSSETVHQFNDLPVHKSLLRVFYSIIHVKTEKLI